MNGAKVLALVACLIGLVLAGCGGGSGGSASSPFVNTTPPVSGSTVFGNISTATGKTGIALTADRATVDVDNGQVVVTARVMRNGAGVANVPVSFAIVAPANGPATVEAGLATVRTDANGVAFSRITTGYTASTTSVIVSATATIGTLTAVANTTFQIVRGNGVIMFTSNAGLTPGSQINQLPDVSKSVAAGPLTVTFLQQIPFRLTDSNGNPRVGIPVSLSVSSQTGGALGLAIDNSPVSTDSAGQGIFNVLVTFATPASGFFTSSSVIYVAATNDANPVNAYIGGSYYLETK